VSSSCCHVLCVCVCVCVCVSVCVAQSQSQSERPTVCRWPSVESGALPIEGGVAVAFRREIEAAADPEAKRRELEEILASQQNPFARGEWVPLRLLRGR
jgi:acetyl-CoA carboxylase carboxyltransferase component